MEIILGKMLPGFRKKFWTNGATTKRKDQTRSTMVISKDFGQRLSKGPFFCSGLYRDPQSCLPSSLPTFSSTCVSFFPSPIYGHCHWSYVVPPMVLSGDCRQEYESSACQKCYCCKPPSGHTPQCMQTSALGSLLYLISTNTNTIPLFLFRIQRWWHNVMHSGDDFYQWLGWLLPVDLCLGQPGLLPWAKHWGGSH